MNQRDKAYFKDRAAREMSEDLPSIEGTVPELLAHTCRILAREGHESGLAGQDTARGEKPGTFWTLQLGYGFDEASAERMVLVDDDLNPLTGGRVNAGVRFHVWIYNNRPEVNAIVHTHPPYTAALALTGKPLKAAHMDSSMLYDNCAYLPDWPGLPVADDEGRIISGALGKKKTILLANHGLLTTGAYVEEAAYLAVFFERAARMELRALAAGGIKEPKPELLRESGEFLLQPSIVKGTFAYWSRKSGSDPGAGSSIRGGP
jgi:L-fuculose-phosphate aldolase